MLLQRAKPYFIGLLLVIAIIIPFLVAGYTSLNRAENAYSTEQYRLAAEEYAHTARILFWRKDLYGRAGISAAQGEDFEGAIAYFKQAKNLTEMGWVLFCQSYAQLQDYPNTISTCKAGLQKYQSAPLYKILAFVYRDQKDWVAELDALKHQTQLDPNDAYAAYRLGVLMALYAPEDSIPELTRASSLNPEVDSAVQTLRAALAVSSQQSDPSMQKVIVGQAFGLVQDWELAKTAFEQAVQQNENNAEAWAWLGEAKQQTGQDGSAELDQALLLDHNSVNVRALRGLYWSRKGKYSQMLAEYSLAARIEPENPRWQASLGEAYSKIGDLVAAMAAYQRAVELDPTQADYWRLLAIFCAENNVHAEDVGIPAAQQAYTLSPNDPASLDALGYAYLSTGRYASAELAFSQAIEISAQYYPAHIHLAMNYLAQGNRAAAFNVLTYVRDADGAGVYAETAKQLLDKYFQ
ncbi:MAG TPA: tetratricopeptide repeat protein [Anaerolineales bacterium]|nr:tetratricopeptide repeat protein [Anaerolineales bacterium]